MVWVGVTVLIVRVKEVFVIFFAKFLFYSEHEIIMVKTCI